MTESADVTTAGVDTKSINMGKVHEACFLLNFGAVTLLLEHADRVRGLQGTELAQEIARLNDPAAPADQLRLAMALSQTRQLYDLVRAQELLQRVLANQTQEARELHVLARLLGARYAEQRRLEEAASERAAQGRLHVPPEFSGQHLP